MKVPVNTSWDFSAGVLTHNAIQIPVPTPVINVSIELPATMFWPPGYAMNKLQMTSTVKHRCNDIVLEGHDHGPMQLHVTLPIVANPLLAVIIPFSSRKFVFASSTVKMNKKSVGCSSFWVTTPMHTCGDPVSAPTTFSMINLLLDNVRVGITWYDLLVGIVESLLTLAIDAIYHKLSGNSFLKPQNITKKAIKESFRKVALKRGKAIFNERAKRAVIKKISEDLIPPNKAAMIKKALATGSELITSTLKGDPTFKISTGNDWVGGSFEIKIKKRTVGAERHIGPIQEGFGSVKSQVFGNQLPEAL